MPIFTRLLDLPDLLTRKSFFLFGPRAAGKSFLVSTQLADRALVIDLLRSDVSYRLAADPTLLEALIGDRRGPRKGQGRLQPRRRQDASRKAASTTQARPEALRQVCLVLFLRAQLSRF